MKVFDPIYRSVKIPNFLYKYLETPEVNRLREVSLINIYSPTFAGLSDITRYSHTIGVIHLSNILLRALKKYYSEENLKTFQIAALLHDVGTPAFGHLVEYVFGLKYSWNHETSIKEILLGNYRPENIDHQLFYGNTLKLYQLLEKDNIEIDDIYDIITGKSELGKYLAGTIDIDNIDNVFRMYFNMGYHPEIKSIYSIVKSLTNIIHSHSLDIRIVEDINGWIKARRLCYTNLNFDPITLSSQAMLSDCIFEAVDNKIDQSFWFYTNRQIIIELLDFQKTKKTIKRLFINDLFSFCFIFKINFRQSIWEYWSDFENRYNFKYYINEKVNYENVFVPYVYLEKGNFSKNISLNINNDKRIISKQSKSIIISFFSITKQIPNKAVDQLKRVVLDFLEKFSIYIDEIEVIDNKLNIYDQSKQGKLFK